MKNVVIIGGGIIGNFIAYYLSGRDINITVIDDQPSMLPASYGNCGLITPSHIMPLNRWSYIFQGLKWLGNKQAPLRIKPQPDTAFLSWFIAFTLYSNAFSRNKAANKRHRLLTGSWELYKHFFEDEQVNCNWKSEGVLYACSSEKGFKSLAEEAAFLDKFRLSNEVLSKNELLQLESSLTDRVIGGAIFSIDGWLNPSELIDNLQKVNARKGISYLQEYVLDFNTSERKIEHLETDAGKMDVCQVVIANGAKSPLLAKKLGIHLPIIPGKGYNITYHKKLENQPQRPVYMVEKKVVATPWESGFRLGSTMEFSGYDLKLDELRLSALKEASATYLKTDLKNEKYTPWAGWRPMTSNELPIIKTSKKYHNLIFATGHGMLGLSMAPMTGYIVNEMLQ
ncbi:MAG: FAD-binding oxidoreductase [Ekhidna sp.]|nr:FAD-binding oxidoreductase [Ekhidna sp.]